MSAAPVTSGMPAADDAVGTEHALVDVGDVHGSALALAHTRGATEELRHHAPHVDAFRDAVAVTAMGGRDEVSVCQVHADTHRHRLLPRIEVQEAGELPGEHELLELLLEAPDQAHPAVGVEQLLPGEVHGEPPSLTRRAGLRPGGQPITFARLPGGDRAHMS